MCRLFFPVFSLTLSPVCSVCLQNWLYWLFNPLVNVGQQLSSEPTTASPHRNVWMQLPLLASRCVKSAAASHPHTNPLCVFLSAVVNFVSRVFLIWRSASLPSPPRAESEARARSSAAAAAAPRSLPYLEVSSTKTARREGDRREGTRKGSEGGGGGEFPLILKAALSCCGCSTLVKAK